MSRPRKKKPWVPVPGFKPKPTPPPAPKPPPPRDLHLVGNALEMQELFPPTGYKSQFRAYWSSPETFAAHVESMDKHKAWHDAGWNTGDKDWYGTSNMQEALDLARNGWKEGANKASKLQNRILAQYPLQKRPTHYDVAGAYPDVPRAIAGNPMNMVVPDLQKSKRRPVITLLSDMSVNCGTNGDELINRAAVVAAIIDHIEAAGYACEVVSFERTRKHHWGEDEKEFDSMVAVKVKAPEQPLDIQRLAFGIGHPSMFRRLCFAEIGYNKVCHVLGSGLGGAIKLPQNELAERNIYVLPSCNSNSHFTTEEKASNQGVAFMVKSLQEQGFPLYVGAKVHIDDVAQKELDEQEED